MNLRTFVNLNIQQLQKYKRARSDAWLHAVRSRLELSCQVQEKEMLQTLEYLKSKDALHVIKKLNKLR